MRTPFGAPRRHEQEWFHTQSALSGPIGLASALTPTQDPPAHGVRLESRGAPGETPETPLLGRLGTGQGSAGWFAVGLTQSGEDMDG